MHVAGEHNHCKNKHWSRMILCPKEGAAAEAKGYGLKKCLTGNTKDGVGKNDMMRIRYVKDGTSMWESHGVNPYMSHNPPLAG